MSNVNGSNPNGKKTIAKIATVVVALVALVFIGLFMGNGSSEPSVKKNSNPKSSDIKTESTLKSLDETTGFRVDRKANDDAVRVDIFFDPLCPWCGQVDRAISEDLDKLTESGEVDLYFYPVSFLDNASSDNYSTRASSAVITIAENSPEHLLAFTEAMFKDQPKEGDEYKPVTNADLAKIAESVGVPADKAALINDELYLDFVTEYSDYQMDRKDLFMQGFSTPSVFVGISYGENNDKDAEKVEFAFDDTRQEFLDTLQPFLDAKTAN